MSASINTEIRIEGGSTYEPTSDGVSTANQQFSIGAGGFPDLQIVFNQPAQFDDDSDLVDWSIAAEVTIAGSSTASLALATMLDRFGIDPDPAAVKLAIFAIDGVTQGTTSGKTVRVGPLGDATAVTFGLDTTAAGIKFNHGHVFWDIGAGWSVGGSGIVKFQNDETVTVTVKAFLQGTSN